MKKVVSLVVALVMCLALFSFASAEDKITLQFQYIGGTVPAQDGVINDAIRAFNEANPNIEVQPIYIDWGNGHSQYYNAVMAKTAPDIAMLGGTWCVEFMEMGELSPIADYVSQELIDTFIPSGFDVMTGSDGTIYGLPWDGCTWGVIYRTDLFEQAGIEKLPTTWDELLEAGAKMKDIGKYLLTVSCNGAEVDDYYLPFLWQAGGEVCHRDENGKWVSSMNSPESLAAAEFYLKLVEEGYMPKEIVGMDAEACLNSFTAGDTAIIVAGMWNIATLENIPEMEGKWKTGNMWAGPGGAAALSYPNTVHISASSAHKEEAGNFLQFFYDNGYYDQYTITSGVFSFTKTFADSEYAQDPMLAPFIQDSAVGRNRPATSKYEEFRSMYFNPGVQSMVAGELSPADFCVQMEEAFNSLHE